jgi:hypothetical protein
MPDQLKNTPTPPAFVEDLFIVDEDEHGNKIVYHVPEQAWKSLPHEVESDVSNPLVARLLPLLRSEVVIASVPKNGDGDEAYYLTDLTAVAINVD